MSAHADNARGFISLRSALIAVLIGVISFSSLIVLMAFAPDLEDKDYAGPHAYSKSALGYNFAVKLLENTDHYVEISRDPGLLTDEYGYGLLVVTPANKRDQKELEEVNFDRTDPTLLVLPKRWGFASFTNKRHQAQVGELSLSNVSGLLQPIDDAFGMRRIPAVDEVEYEGRAHKASFTDRTQIITSGPITPIISIDEGVIFGKVEGTNLYILTDPELMNTHGLRSIHNAELLIDMFDDMTGRDADFPIVFDTTLHGFERTRNLLRMLFEPPLLAATLFALATALLLGWSAFVRFGRLPQPEPVFATGRATLIESTSGLFTQTEREVSVADDYADLAKRLAVQDLGYSEDMTNTQIDSIIENAERQFAEKHGQHTERPNPASVKTPGQLVSFAQAYHQWKKDLNNGRK
jgi:hypothetical protein